MALEQVFERSSTLAELRSAPLGKLLDSLCKWLLNHGSAVRYVERNALRAGLVQRAEDWRWGSLHQRTQQACGPLLCTWPLPLPSDWTEYVNLPQTEAELEAVRRCVRRGSPYGNAGWAERTAEGLGLQSTLRRRGRPRKDGP